MAKASAFDDVDVQAPNLESILVDDEVESKYRAIQEKLAAGADAPAVEDNGMTEEQEEETEQQKKEAAEQALAQAKAGGKKGKGAKGVVSPKAKGKAKEGKAKDEEEDETEQCGILSRRPPPRWRRLLNRGFGAQAAVALRELRVKSTRHDSTSITLLYPCKVRVVRRRLALELRHSVDDLFLVYLGRMLKDEEVLPEECFHCRRFNFVRWLDGKGIDRYLQGLREERERKEAEEAKRNAKDKRLARLQQQKSRKDLGEEGSELIGIDEEDEEDDEGNENGNANDPRLGSPLSGALEGVAEEGEDDEEEGGRETGAAAVVNFALGTKRPTAQTRRVARGKTFRTTRKSRRMADEFDLVSELQHINCGQFTELLLSKGFADKGAFAYVTEAELMGPGLWINKRAARRILGLADVYKRQIDIENQGHSSDLEQISLNMTNRQKYTVDGIHFFSTQQELNAWLEVQKNKKTVAKTRQLSVKREHSAELLDVYASIEARLQADKEKEEGELSRRTPSEPNICCNKHQKSFDDQVEMEVQREAVDYENDFVLLLEEANKVKSTYVPGDLLLSVVTQVFQKHRFPLRQRLVDDLMAEASLDDQDMYYDAEILKKRVVEHLKERKRHLLLHVSDC